MQSDLFLEGVKLMRNDSWSPEEDTILAETVLRFIRQGGTQLGAFAEVGETTGRTAAAVGFRWNNNVRKRYEDSIIIAKRERTQHKKSSNNRETVVANMSNAKLEGNADTSAAFFIQQIMMIEETLQKLKMFIGKLLEENIGLKEKISKTPMNTDGELSEDAQNLLRILDNARRMGLLHEERRSS